MQIFFLSILVLFCHHLVLTKLAKIIKRTDILFLNKKEVKILTGEKMIMVPYAS